MLELQLDNQNKVVQLIGCILYFRVEGFKNSFETIPKLERSQKSELVNSFNLWLITVKNDYIKFARDLEIWHKKKRLVVLILQIRYNKNLSL